MAHDVAKLILKLSESDNAEHLKKSYVDPHYRFFNKLKYILFDEIYARNKDFIRLESIDGMVVESIGGLKLCNPAGLVKFDTKIKSRGYTYEYSETTEETQITLAFIDETYLNIFVNFLKNYDLKLIITFYKYQHSVCISWEHWKIN